ncbi:F-box and associated interaction domains-containing protein [Striga asiatica]|uniref:F-box and associated interaction domains-containing protein n=1 Tax=Striga asiatica TaxID=4170 RepID=A0A5A7PWT4_STRAF|nr:F-box and associated interaction domains-containing protein [Striga asiatica]
MALTNCQSLLAILVLLLPIATKGDDHIPPSLSPFFGLKFWSIYSMRIYVTRLNVEEGVVKRLWVTLLTLGATVMKDGGGPVLKMTMSETLNSYHASSQIVL